MPHSTSANLANDGVIAENRARRQPWFFIEQMRHGFDERLRQKRAGACMVIQKRLHFGADGLVRFILLQPCRESGRFEIDGSFEEISGTSMLFGIHALSSRNSQARARLHRRFKVAGDMAMASAASSTLIPAK